MRWADLPLNPSPRTLRQFARLWIVFFGGLAVWRLLIGDDVSMAGLFALAGVTVGPLGLLVPAAIRPIFVLWTVLAFPIGWLVSRVVIFLLFVAVVTPVALFWQMRGRDALALKRRPGATTYWARKPEAPDLASYFRQS